MKMEAKQIKAAVDYINANAARLHGVASKDVAEAVGGAITVDDVVKSRLDGDDAVLIVNRGIKGTPKYRIPAGDVELFANEQKTLIVAERQAADAAKKAAEEKAKAAEDAAKKAGVKK